MKPIRRAPRPKAEAIRIKMRTGKYSDGKYVPGISGYVILKSIDTCQEKKLIIFFGKLIGIHIYEPALIGAA
jgi:hypothetical protein